MIPEIRDHARSLLRRPASDGLDTRIARVVAAAFDFYRLLDAWGLSQLAYPEPLAMVALLWVEKSRVKE
jgi:hypothetical protein